MLFSVRARKHLQLYFILRKSLFQSSFNCMQKGDDPGKFRQLDEILFVDGYPKYQQLMSTAENCMQVVCEVKGDI